MHVDIVVISKLEIRNVNICEEIQQMEYDKTEGPRESAVKELWHFQH